MYGCHCTDANNFNFEIIRQEINQLTVTKKPEIIVFLPKKAISLPRKKLLQYRWVTWSYRGIYNRKLLSKSCSRLLDRNLVKAPSNFIAGRPKAALLFWFFCDFRCDWPLLHGLPMLVDKTNFGLVLYNHANFYRFEKTSSYWSVERISVFLCFSLVIQWHTSGITVYNRTLTNIEITVRAMQSCNSLFIFILVIYKYKYR